MTLMVCLQHVTKEFSAGKQTVRAVDDVSLEIERGEIFGVIGYSGAGKSTLVRLINALESPTSGTVIIDGETITGRTERQLRPVRARIGFIFQQFNLLGSRTVAGNIGYPLQVAHWSKERREARVTELLQFVGLSDKARPYPDQLRVAVVFLSATTARRDRETVLAAEFDPERLSRANRSALRRRFDALVRELRRGHFRSLAAIPVLDLPIAGVTTLVDADNGDLRLVDDGGVTRWRGDHVEPTLDDDDACAEVTLGAAAYHDSRTGVVLIQRSLFYQLDSCGSESSYAIASLASP